MIWRICERFDMLPPDIKSEWDKCDPWAQSLLLAYSQIRDYEDSLMAGGTI